jgi:hypothetical protein
MDIDADFVNILQQACDIKGIGLLHITPENLRQMSRPILRRDIGFKVFFDRASDTDIRFISLVYWTRDRTCYRINPYEKAVVACDKADMHYRIIRAGIRTPTTLVVPAYSASSQLPDPDIRVLGYPFLMKPARGRGGEGIVADVTSLEQMQRIRQLLPDEAYLLQQLVVPAQLDGSAAWFRVIYCTGHTYICWWDLESHRYTPVTERDTQRYSLCALAEIVHTIAHICELDLFSTEIALTPDDEFLVIDYVNDQIDLRVQSKFFDGVPDWIIGDIAERIVQIVEKECQ